jgi:hypothetical protein
MNKINEKEIEKYYFEITESDKSTFFKSIIKFNIR